jgi:hypothetical protein
MPTIFYIDPDGTHVGTQLDFYEEMHQRSLAPDERKATSAETDQALADAEANGGIFNGCINYYLHQRFGDCVRHIMGYGWVIREIA